MYDEVCPEIQTLEASRLGFLVSYSGQKVIHLRKDSLHAFPQGRRETLPSMQFSGRQNDDLVMPRRIVLDELANDVTA